MKLMGRNALYSDESNSDRVMDEQDIFNCISTMLRQEELYLCHDYLNGDDDEVSAGPHYNKRDAIDESCRAKMCEWIFHVIDSTRLQRETGCVAMDFLDRFLCSSSQRATQAQLNRKEYQLAGKPLPF